MHRIIYISLFAALMVTPPTFMTGLNLFAQADSDDGVTPLMSAARDADSGAFNRALRKTPNIDAQDAYGWTALTYAAVRGDKNMVKKLLSRQANPNIVDEDGRSALMHAVNYEREDIVKLLIEGQADLEQRDNRGATAMGLAWTKSMDRIEALLEEAGAAKLATEDKRVDIYNPLPPYNGPFLLNVRDSLHPILSIPASGVYEWKMRVLVGIDGSVRKVRVLIGLPNGGTEQVIRDAYNSRYQPAIKNGQPIEVWTDRGATIRRTLP